MNKPFIILLTFLLAFQSLGLAITPTIKPEAATNSTNDSDWTLFWSDEFDGTEIDKSKWSYDIGNWIVDGDGNGVARGWGNNELEYYTDSPENSYIQDGNLVIEAKKEETTDEYGSYDYTSAKLKTKGLFSKKYGKFEARMKLPSGQGYWPAFWMLPENDVYGGWAASGEIDIMEAAGKNAKEVGGALHFGQVAPNNVHTAEAYQFPEGESNTDFHTYSIEWEPGEIRWYVDGNLYQTSNNWYSKDKNNAEKYSFPAPFDQEFYLVLNLAVGGWYGGDPDATTTFPGKMEVDYVRVYELTGRDYKTPVEPSVEKVELPADAKMPQADGNLIYDNDYIKGFTDISAETQSMNPLYWNFLYLPSFGGDGGITTDTINGEAFAKVEVNNPGNALWSLQKIQLMSIASGGKYKVSFDAKSTGNRNMMVKVSGGADRGWAKYSNEEIIELTSEVQSYEFSFDMIQDTDLAARLEFNMGANGNNPIWIGNVRVEDITGVQQDYSAKEPLLNGNHVYNGTFDQGTMDRMTFWNFNQNDGLATGNVSEATREFKTTIADGGSSSTAIQLTQKGMNLLEGKDYELTFNARADQPRDIQVDFLSKDGTVVYSTNSVNLSDEMNKNTIEFTMPGGVTDTQGQLVFNLGGNSSDVYIDDVMLLNLSGNMVIPSLVNGDFSNGLEPWSQYIHFDAQAQITEANGEAKAAITNPGGEEWGVLLEQKGLKFGQGQKYTVSFDARSTTDRPIVVSLENAEYKRYLSEVTELTNEMKSFTYDVDMTANDTLSLKFQMGKYGLDAHDIFIDNVKIITAGASQPEEPTTPEPTPELDNGTFDTAMDGWVSWWGDQWSGVAEGSANVENGELKVDITKVGGASYSPQIFQKGITFEKGKTYNVTFDARANDARKVNVNIGKELTEDPWFIPYAPTQTFDLTNEMQTFTYSFEMTEDTFNDGKIVFELGNIQDGNAATTVFLDNVSITPQQPAPTPELDNGTFDTAMDGWFSWWGDQWSGVAEGSADVENGELKVDITKVGGASYSPQIYQKEITFEKGKTYNVTFDARANDARKVNVNIGKELTEDPWFISYAPTQTFDLTNEMQTFTYSFEMTEDTFNDGKIVFELGNIQDGNAATTVFLDNVSITVDGSGSIIDQEAPVISGAADQTVKLGDAFDPLYGVKATDNADGDITSSMIVNGTVNTSVAGSYTLTYISTDSSGNTAKVERKIIVIKSGWLKENGYWFYYDSKTGIKKTGWLQDGSKWYYLDGNGVMKTGWILSGGKWYFLEESGAMKTGWVKSGTKWYYLQSGGAMKTGWLKSGGKWYYLESSGAMKTGWLKSGGKWYYLEGSGVMKTGWLKSGGKWYYLENSGAMKTGWVKSGTKWYYLENSGAMKTGWIKSGSKWYYLYSSGAMAYNTTIDGYKLGADGAWIQ
ncbi:carbohydrate binding domain-containing protein [Mesobacillus selenatarsenatis]|nr:carbohydrate binding domain-containing protein [Mesobacillus selenatarsenatis]